MILIQVIDHMIFVCFEIKINSIFMITPGYVQGMTDLAAPLLYIFEGNPVKAFWCFTGVLNLTVSF